MILNNVKAVMKALLVVVVFCPLSCRRQLNVFFFCKIFLLIIKHSYYKLLQTINLHIYTCTHIEVDYKNPTIINDVIYVNKPVNSQ